MNGTELTMSDVLRDPVIRLVLRADRISLGDFAKLLEQAASSRNKSFAAERQYPQQSLSH